MLCGRTEEVRHTVGPPRHRHFVGVSSVPGRVSTRGQPFYGYYENPSLFNHLLRRALVYGDIFSSFQNPPGPHGGINLNVFIFILI